MNPNLSHSLPFFQLDLAMNHSTHLSPLPTALPPSLVHQPKRSHPCIEPSIGQQALFRALKMKLLGSPSSPISPLSPQESLGLSDDTSLPSQHVESYRFRSSNGGCVQSQAPSFYNEASPYQGHAQAASSYHSDVQLSDLPIVRGAAAFQRSSEKRTSNNTEDGRAVRMGSLQFHAEDKESKRLKRTWEELERELLGDDEDDIVSTSVSMIYHDGQAELSVVKADPMERDWADIIEELFAESSGYVPVVVGSSSATSDEHSTNICSDEIGASWMKGKDPPFTPHSNCFPTVLQQHQKKSIKATVDTTSQPKQLLVSCATAIADNNIDLARSIVAKLKQVVSIYGDPMQRLAAYMVEGLVARIELSGHGLYKALKCVEPPSMEILSATQILYQSCPYIKFGYMAANGAIAEAFKDENKVHIIDFEIGHGSQWIAFIGAFAARPSGPPEVRITGVADPDSNTSPAGSLQSVGKRLGDLAKSVGVPFQFHQVAMKVSEVQPSMFEKRPGEALAVNFAFQLHSMPDESVCITNPRDRLLRMVRVMEPKVVTVVEMEANTNTAPFFPRFLETLSYYGALFQSLDVSLPRESRQRVDVEQHCLARDIVNIIACEGSDRVERYELAGKWRARLSMAGFRPCPLSSYINSTIRPLLQNYSKNYRLKEEAGALHLGWLDRALIVASAWH